MKRIIFAVLLVTGGAYAADQGAPTGQPAGLVPMEDPLAFLLPPGMNCNMQRDPQTGMMHFSYTFGAPAQNAATQSQSAGNSDEASGAESTEKTSEGDDQ